MMAEELGENVTTDTAAPSKKRSLFKKPLWTNPPEDEEEEEGVSFFSRAKDLYPIRVAEEERKRQRKLKKLERKRSTASAEREASKTPEVNKRRRISSQADNHFSDSSPDNSIVHKSSSNRKPSQSSPKSGRSVSSQPKFQASPTSLTARYNRELNAKEHTTQIETQNTGFVSLLSDSEGDDDRTTLPVKNVSSVQAINIDDEDDFHPTSVPDEDESPMSDEEFPELVQKAREREEKKALERLNAEKSFGERNHGDPSPIDDIFEYAVPAVDPVVEILVTSVIEGTKPMIFRRKISQPLKPIREGWVTKQIEIPEFRSFVFLTWRGKKVYDVATCAFLGLKAGIDGKLTSVGNTLDENGRLHFEAWTANLFDAHLKRLEKGAAQEELDEEEEPVKMTKLILKARNLEPVMIKVKPTTSIQKLMNHFRSTHNIGEDKDVVLFFDGDKLDPNLNVQDTELGDRDNVDVHIR